MEAEELQRLKRMSEQTHPDVLPLCIDSVEAARNSLAESIESLESLQKLERRKDLNVIGVTAVTTTVAAIEFIMFDNRFFSGDYSLSVVFSGFAGAALLAYRQHCKDKARRKAHGRLISEHAMLTLFHNDAATRGQELQKGSNGDS